MNRMQQSGLGLRTSNQYAAGRQFGRDLTNLNSDDETSYEAPKKVVKALTQEISHPLQQIKCPGLPNQLAGSFVGHPPNHYKTAPPYQMSENGELSKRGLPARQNFQRNAFENNLASGNLPLNKTCQGQNRLYNSQRNIGLQLKQSKLRDYQPLSQTQINLPAPLVPLVHSQGPPFQQQIPLPINLTSSQVQVPLQKPQLPEEVQVSEEYGDMDSELRNPQLCEEYQADIFDFCFKREVRNKHKNILTQQVKNLCKSNYFVLRQQSINDKMRAILIDWIVDVHAKFKMTPQTFFLSVNLIDRFLETFNCPRNQLQLVGIASLFLASKYEEIYPPELKDFSTVCDRTYSEDQIVDMESQILLTLSFDLVFTSCFQFHEMFCQKRKLLTYSSRSLQRGIQLRTLPPLPLKIRVQHGEVQTFSHVFECNLPSQ